jgi:hypothetical protein
MIESRTAETLRNKRNEIARSIDEYEKRLAQARADLAHVDAAIAIFSTSGDGFAITPYVDIHRLFKCGEMVAICREALKTGPKNTRQLSALILETKGLDAGDRVLAKAVSYRLIHALRMQARTGKLVGIGREKAARVWRLPGTLV